MPLYDIEHVTPLTDAQQGELAKSLTAAHAKRFGTPSYFVNVRYTDVSEMKLYRGGVLRKYNRAILRTRNSEKRSVEMFNEHCMSVIECWEKIVGSEGEKALRTVWVLGALTTAVEAGFARPKAGEEHQWLRENKSAFQKLADEGDEDFIGLMEELSTREDFKDI
ncbi:hypothetical protein F5884DRAFT_862212 [Xylogone sp. PMI_703]|nr:hypothetical protein F5884DRAFT_862212 [Xylogone sp. PMI_703]